MKKQKLILAEDHVIMREGLCSMLESTGRYEVVGQANNGLEAIHLVEKDAPDMMLLDISMPQLNGLSVIHNLRNRYPKVKFIVLTVHDTEEYLQEIMSAGAHGYCLKKGDFSELLTAIDTVLLGKPYASPHMTEPLLNNFTDKNKGYRRSPSEQKVLTQREKEILKLVGEGYKNKQIAELLFISPKTVEKHRSNLMAKLDLHNASSLTAYAIKMGLVLDPT